jgi:hypothetical protein
MDEEVVSPAQVKEDLDRMRRDLAATLSTQIAAHAVSLEMGRDGLVISLREAGFFDPARLCPSRRRCPRCADRRQAERHALRSAHRGPHRQCADSQRAVRLELGAFGGARYAHRAAVSGNEGHSCRPAFRRRICRVPSCAEQRHPGRPRGKPPRGSGGDAATTKVNFAGRRAAIRRARGAK